MNTCNYVEVLCSMYRCMSVCVCITIEMCVCVVPRPVYICVYVHMMTAYLRNVYKLYVCVGTHKSVEEGSGIRVKDGLVLVQF